MGHSSFTNQELSYSVYLLKAFFLEISSLLLRKQSLIEDELTLECMCVFVHAGSGYHALSWCRSGWTKSWTRRKCWRAGSRTSASQYRWLTTVPCSTAVRCRETPAARPVTVTEQTHVHRPYEGLSVQMLWSIRFSVESPALHRRTQKTVPVAQSGKKDPLHWPQDTHTCT